MWMVNKITFDFHKIQTDSNEKSYTTIFIPN